MKTYRVVEEDFSNYKLPCMFISAIKCTWKCCIEQNIDVSVCQNFSLKNENVIDFSSEKLYNMYVNNSITQAIVFGGLEPLEQLEEVIEVIDYFRKKGENSTFIIYTGYYPYEVSEAINRLKNYSNIIVKFGRFIPNSPHKFCEVLGVELASENQYAEAIS